MKRSSAQLVGDDDAYPLAEGENIIGRDEDCSVRIDISGVSRRHAKLTVSEEHTLLEDLESTQGTWLNGQRIYAPVEVREGDQIAIGRATLTFRTAPPNARRGASKRSRRRTG